MLSWKKILVVTLGAGALSLAATSPAYAAQAGELNCEDQSAVTGTVLTKAPAAACRSQRFGAICVLYTHENNGTTEKWTCYVPIPI